jgi:hypothetical protein
MIVITASGIKINARVRIMSPAVAGRLVRATPFIFTDHTNFTDPAVLDTGR